MVQDIEGELPSSTSTKEEIMVKTNTAAKPRVAAKGTRSTRRISESQYKEIASIMRDKGLDVTTINVVITGSPIIGRKFPATEVTEARMAKLKKLIRDMDAAADARAKSKLAGSIEGVRKGDMADLLLKSIVTEAVKAATLEILEGTRKLLLAQEMRFQSQLRKMHHDFEAMAEELNIKIPPFEGHAELMPVIESSGQVVRAPRILVYGIQANQKQPMHDHVREWGKHNVATIDVGYSSGRVVDMKRGYDVIIVNRNFVGMDEIRDLQSHGNKVITVSGSISAVELQLKKELLEIEIDVAIKRTQTA